jgi:hypothetical protein
MNQICPWCDAEIVWDEEIGPEEHCPHCLNELGNYRSVSVNSSTIHVEENEDEDEAAPFAKVGSTPELDAYARQVLEKQADWLLCAACEEPMLHIGSQTVSAPGFRPTLHAGHAILAMPFATEWFVCPSCDRIDQVLSLGDKKKWLQRIEENGQ